MPKDTNDAEIADDGNGKELVSRNAFTELMSSGGKPRTVASKHSRNAITTNRAYAFSGRDALGAYTDQPEDYSPSRVLSFDEDFVIINDLYPKSSVHMLLLPRNREKQLRHPFVAFEDPEFYASVLEATQRLKRMVASELCRRYGQFSSSDRLRQEALDAEEPPPSLPLGRDWEKDVLCGIHAVPSMSHLHIHVLSVDRFSECMRHRKHYNSFATPFFVAIQDFPLASDDPRRTPGRHGFLDSDLKCWRCGKNFGKHFKLLKDHLQEEFEQWKAE